MGANPLAQAQEAVGHLLSSESPHPQAALRQQAQRQQVRMAEEQAAQQRQLADQQRSEQQAQRVQDALDPAIARDHIVPEMPPHQASWRSVLPKNLLKKRPFAKGIVGDDTLITRPEHAADVNRWTHQIMKKRLAIKNKAMEQEKKPSKDSESTASSIFGWLRMTP